MSDSGLSVPSDTPQPKTNRDLPDDPVDRIFFLLQRLDRRIHRLILKDLGRVHEALGLAHLSPSLLRQVRKDLGELAAGGRMLDELAKDFRRDLTPGRRPREEAVAWFQRLLRQKGQP